MTVDATATPATINAAAPPPAAPPPPAPSAAAPAGDIDAVMAAAESIFADTDAGGEDSDDGGESGAAAGGTETASGDGKPAGAAAGEKPPEGDAAAAKPKEGEPGDDKGKPRNQQRDLDAEFAKARRWHADLDKRQGEIEQQRTELAQQRSQLESFGQLLKDNPIGALERIAAEAKMKPSEALLLIQNRLANDDKPGESEVIRELREVKAALKARDEAQAKKEQEAAKSRESQSLVQAKSKDVEALAGDLTALADRFPHLAALQAEDEAGLRQQLVGAIDYVYQNRIIGDTVSVLTELEALEAANHQRHQRVGQRLSTRVGTPAAQAGESQAAGQAAPAQGAKAGGATRTVHSTDAAQSSGARREKTPEERMAEAEAIFR